MTAIHPIPLPQMGANDTTAIIVEIAKQPGEQVRKGEVICVAETTKSIFDIEATHDGWITFLAETGGELAVGEPVAAICDTPTSAEEILAFIASVSAPVILPQAEGDAATSWTMKAEMVARQQGIEIQQVAAVFPGKKITEADVHQFLAEQSAKPISVTPAVRDLVNDPYPAGRVQRLVIVGGGEGAVQILDALAKIPGQHAVAIVDDNATLHGRSVAGVPVVGPVDATHVKQMIQQNQADGVVISVSTSIPFRQRIFDEWSAAGIPFANVVHPSAQVGINAAIGAGNVILAFCQIGPCATVGNNNFLSAYCSIEHHSTLGNHCSFGPGVITSSRANIGDRARFGTGIFIEPHITVGHDSVVGSGCILWSDVPPESVLKSKLNYAIRQKKVKR